MKQIKTKSAMAQSLWCRFCILDKVACINTCENIVRKGYKLRYEEIVLLTQRYLV